MLLCANEPDEVSHSHRRARISLHFNWLVTSAPDATQFFDQLHNPPAQPEPVEGPAIRPARARGLRRRGLRPLLRACPELVSGM